MVKGILIGLFMGAALALGVVYLAVIPNSLALNILHLDRSS